MLCSDDGNTSPLTHCWSDHTTAQHHRGKSGYNPQHDKVFTLISTISLLGSYPKDILAKIWSDSYNMLFTIALFEPERTENNTKVHQQGNHRRKHDISTWRMYQGTACSHKKEWERFYIPKLDFPPSYTKLNKQGTEQGIEYATLCVKMAGKKG